jgi:hypothetical protein
MAVDGEISRSLQTSSAYINIRYSPYWAGFFSHYFNVPVAISGVPGDPVYWTGTPGELHHLTYYQWVWDEELEEWVIDYLIGYNFGICASNGILYAQDLGETFALTTNRSGVVWELATIVGRICVCQGGTSWHILPKNN